MNILVGLSEHPVITTYIFYMMYNKYNHELLIILLMHPLKTDDKKNIKKLHNIIAYHKK